MSNAANSNETIANLFARIADLSAKLEADLAANKALREENAKVVAACRVSR